MKVECPKCHEVTEYELGETFAPESMISFRVVPKPGEMLSVKHVGGLLEQFHKLLDACARDAEHKVGVTVKSLRTEDDGAVVLDALILRRWPKRAKADP